MSFNIRFGTAADGENHWDKRKDFLVETIKAFAPDLLGTQETLAFQRDLLAGKLPHLEAFGAGRDDGEEKGEMAALFYNEERFEKMDDGHFWLSETSDKAGSKSWDSSLPRIVTWIKLRDRREREAPAILFLNTHFDHRGAKARLESARLLRKQLGALGKECSLIVSGDFNAPEGSEPYRALFESKDDPLKLIDTYRAVHPKRGPDEGTYSGFNAELTHGSRIDWIACCTAWQIRAGGIDRTQRDGRTPSDHFPVTAVLRRRAR